METAIAQGASISTAFVVSRSDDRSLLSGIRLDLVDFQSITPRPWAQAV